MPTARLNLRIKQALDDNLAAKQLIDFLDALDPDGDGALDADQVVYDPATSGLAATDAQAAIDEVEARVDTVETDLADVQSGTATIANGTTSIAVTVGAAYNGKLAVVSMAEAPTAAALLWSGPVAGGDLTINSDVDNTADLDVHFILDGR